MAVKNFYPTNNLASVHQEMSETVPGATPVFLSPVTGWVVGTAITNRSKLNSQVEATVFDSATYPNGTIDTTNGDCFRSTNTYTGSFAATTWSFRLLVASNTIVAGSGRAYFRLFRGANADGSGATEITSSALQGNTVGLVVGALNAVTSLNSSFSPGAVSLTNEYLFIQVAWERTVAGGMSTSDVNIVVYNGGQCLVTPDFTPAATVFTKDLTATLSSTAALVKRITDSGFTAALSFIGNLAATKLGQLFLKSFSATLNPATGGLLNDGDPVSIWPDQSGNGNHATQSGSLRPTFRTSVVNSKPAVRFDGSDDYMVAPNGAISGLSSAMTCFIVQKVSVVQNSHAIVAVTDDIFNRFSINLPWSDGNIYFDFGNYSGTGRAFSAWGGNTSDFFVWSFKAGASNMTVYRNGTSIVSVGASDTFTPGSKVLNIGGNTGVFHNADMAEVILYNVVLSSTDRANVEKYLGDKYGITVAGGSAVDPTSISGLQLFLQADSVSLPVSNATLSLKPLKALAATLSFAAALSRRIAKTLTATSSRTAALTKKFIDSAFTATLSFVGTFAKTRLILRALTATLSFTGATLSRRIGKALSAELDSAATLAKNIRKTLTAGLSFIGNLVTEFISGGEVFFQNLTATLSFSGALAASKSFLKAFAATLSFTATLSRRAAKAFAATLNRSATLVKRIADAGFAATLSFAGAVTKRIVDFGFAATLAFAGFLTASKSFLKAFAATLSFTGTVATFVAHFFTRAFTATLSFSGTITRRIAKAFSATRSFIGNLATTFISGAQEFTQAFTATLNTAGALAKRIPKAFTASLSFVGAVGTAAVHFFTRSFAATQSFIGNLTRTRVIARAFTATLAFAGAIRRRTGKALAATLGFSSAVRKGIRKGLSAVLSFIGFLFRGGFTQFLAGQIAGAAVRIGLAGSTASIAQARSQLEVRELGSGARIPVTGSQLTVERTE